jgi:hypothetical protein
MTARFFTNENTGAENKERAKQICNGWLDMFCAILTLAAMPHLCMSRQNPRRGRGIKKHASLGSVLKA